ncbi:nitrate- and nitrite sensing domain-containing protein [Micromonospora sp. NPDC050417]|uniref:sensor histidine kinase n=1 Tax=Micromonospora sp. NPDC050417 TaxID=3364280 RepID=UPI003796903D
MAAALDPSGSGVPTHRRRRLDVRVVPHRRRSPLRLRDWRLRVKLGAVLIIPSVAFLVVATVQTGTLLGQANVLGEFSQEVTIGRQITALVHELQAERDRTAGELAAVARSGGRADPGQIQAALKSTYDAANVATTQLQQAAQPLVDVDASWRVSYSRVQDALRQLPDVRAAVPAGVLSVNTVLGNYNRSIDALLTLLAEPSPGDDQPDLTNRVLRYVQIARVKEISSRIRSTLYSAARAGRYDLDDGVELTDLRAQQLTALGDFRVAATTPQIQLYQQAAADPAFQNAIKMEEETIAVGAGTPQVLSADEWWRVSQHRQDLLRQVEAAVLGDAARAAEERSSDQLRETLLVAGGVLGVLLIGLATSVVIGRSLNSSLRLLRAQALQVAQIDLPEALERLRTVESGVPQIEVPPAMVRSMDEIGEVAEAFVAVHRSAVTVAVEQAVMRRNVNAMFVNLARRSQLLVERQLELLDDLEREESDPDQLDNLFKLDHLAARMRRNDDSLLVLAGTESTRRWNRPVPLSAVMLAAVAEVEQYQRVRHESADQLHIVGHAVADLVHLLAELLENAATFSPPETLVRISGRAEAPGAGLIEIVDDGLGMSQSAIDEANELLAEPPAADVAASERMGLFVVSHLAARQHIQVRLRALEHGVLASILLPPALLAAPPSQAELEQAVPNRRMLAGLPAGASGGPRAGSGMPNGLPGLDEQPIAGRPPGRKTTRRPSRNVPTRAEDVLAPAAGGAMAGSTWWSRQGKGNAGAPVAATAVAAQAGGAAASAADATAPPAAAAPPVRVAGTAQVTVRVNANGLPVRVPMAQLPSANEPSPQAAPVPRQEPDPEAVGGMLSKFYGGVRRAEAEETTEITMAPAGAGKEEEQQ